MRWVYDDMLETIVYAGYHLDSQKYKVAQTKSNRGDKYGLPHLCAWEKDKDLDNQFIPIGEPCINLTEIEKVEHSERKYFKSWRFHNEQCLVNWLEEFNPEDRL